ncbi:hypothetical protein BGX23_000908 [Mortierella sp. AD031]|nr:hypothetical protein BGX23_000908 [Mortierella sp. AD031]
MEILKEEFEANLPLLQEAIANCDFVSMDTEMTGLSTPANSHRHPDSLSTRYSKISTSASEFLVCQLGICTFTWSDKLGAYEARPFNLPCFPSNDDEAKSGERFFTSQSSSLEFLLKNSFDFNKWIRHGIPYLTRREEADYIVRKTEKEAAVANASFNDMPIDDRNRVFVNSTIAKIKEWMEISKDDKDDSLTIPANNGFYRRLVHQVVRNEFNSNLHTTSNSQERTMTLRHMTDEIRQQKEEAKIAKPPKLNLRRVLDMISEAKKPLIGHNCYLDLMQISQQFLWDLPIELEDWKRALMLEWKTVIDTKYLATHPLIKEHLDNSGLEQVSLTVQKDPFATVGPKIVMAENFNRYSTNSKIEHQEAAISTAVDGTPIPAPAPVPVPDKVAGYNNAKYHEAGYDAFITGQAYLRFAGFILKERQRQEEEELEPSWKKRRIDSSDDVSMEAGSEAATDGDSVAKGAEKDSEQEKGTEEGAEKDADKVEDEDVEDGEVEETPMEKEALLEKRKRVIMENPTQDFLENNELQDYYNKLYIMRSDFPVMYLAGPDPEPEDRPWQYMLRNVPASTLSSTMFYLFRQFNPYTFTWTDDSNVWIQINRFAPAPPGEESQREPYELKALPLGRLGEDYVNPFCVGDDEQAVGGREVGVTPEAANIEVITWKQWWDEREAQERQQREVARQQREQQALQQQLRKKRPFRAFGQSTPQMSVATPVTKSPRLLNPAEPAKSDDIPSTTTADVGTGSKRKYDGDGQEGRE